MDRDTTLEKFISQIKMDDSFVKEVSILVANTQTGSYLELSDQNEEIYQHLVAHSNRKLYIKLNDNMHEIPTVGSQDLPHECDI